MKVTLELKSDLIKDAMNETGIFDLTALVHFGLQELIRKAAYKRLIALGGSDPKAKTSPRRKSKNKKSVY